MNGRYLTLAGRIRRELQDLEDVVSRCVAIWQQYQVSQNDLFLDGVALNLHSFYTGIERILDAIADTIDEYKPSGSSWHRDLLFQLATEVPEIRPAVLSQSLQRKLDRYRGFRHVVRNIYAFRLDAAQIEPLVIDLATTFENCQTELLQFTDFLAQVGQ